MDIVRALQFRFASSLSLPLNKNHKKAETKLSFFRLFSIHPILFHVHISKCKNRLETWWFDDGFSIAKNEKNKGKMEDIMRQEASNKHVCCFSGWPSAAAVLETFENLHNGTGEKKHNISSPTTVLNYPYAFSIHQILKKKKKKLKVAGTVHTHKQDEFIFFLFFPPSLSTIILLSDHHH